MSILLQKMQVHIDLCHGQRLQLLWSPAEGSRQPVGRLRQG
jgi:hypothetical protein